MAKGKAKQQPKLVRGLALWCKPSTPDYKFNVNGEYSTKLVLTEDEKLGLEDELNSMVDAIYDEVVAKAKKPELAKKQLKKVYPFKPEINEETGEHTGNWILSFKRPAKFVNKQTGEEWPQTVPVFIAKNTLAPKGYQIGNGSEIVVAYTINGSKDYDNPGYFVASSKEVGVSLRLEAISVKKLVEYSGSSNPFGDDDFGDGDAFEDDGFNHETTPTNEGDNAVSTEDDDSPF